VRYALPAFRSLVAKELIKNYGFSQVAVAEKLGTTQAAISHYIHLKRGKRIRQLESIPFVQSTVKEVARSVATEEFSAIDVTQTFCKLCTALKRNGIIHNLHKDFTSLQS
jgi:predicted transcriptional regulator